MRIEGKEKASGIVLFIVAAIVFVMLKGSVPTFALPLMPTNQCTSALNLQCGSQINGTVTSLSQVQIKSNFGPLNGAVWLVNFVLNGGGQSLYGFQSTAQAIASQFNSSAKVANNYPISIGAKLNFEKLLIPYSASGTTLLMLRPSQVNFGFGYWWQGDPFVGGTSCVQSNQSQFLKYFSIACYGSNPQLIDFDALKSYNTACTSLGGTTFYNASLSPTVVIGSIYIPAYAVQCFSVSSAQIGVAYQAGSPSISENISVTYINGSVSHSFYLNARNPQQSYNNQLFAQVYGYTLSGLNTYIGTTAPTLTLMSNGTPLFLQGVSAATVQQLSAVPSGLYSTAGLNLAGQPVSFIYSFSPFIIGLQTQNTNMNNFLVTKIQTSSPFAGITPLGYLGVQANYPDGYTGAPYYGVVDVTATPPAQPNIQFISTANTLGIFIPVAYPKIIAVFPSPVVIQSGSVAIVNFTIFNNASVSGSAYLTVFAQNSTLIAQTPNFNLLPNNQPNRVQVALGGYSPQNTNLSLTWTAIATSTQISSISSTFQFPVIIKRNCQANSAYYNTSTCKGSGTCNPGFYYNGTACHLICSAPSVWNATTQACYTPPVPLPSPSIPWGWVVLVIILIVVILYFGAKGKLSNVKRIGRR